MGIRESKGQSYVMKCKIGLDGYWKEVPSRFCNLLGYSEEELKQLQFAEICHPEDRDKSFSLTKKLKSGELREFEIENRYLTNQGEPLWMYVSGVLIKGDTGKPQYVVCYCHDISKVKKNEERARVSEERWRRLVRENPQPIQITQDAKIVFINQAGVDLYGADSQEELIGKSVYEFSDPEMVAAIKRRKSRLEKGKKVDEVFEHKINCLDGKERYVDIYSIPTTYENNSTIQSVIYNVTQRKKQQQKMLQSLDEKKMLLREIHHRVKNNLAVISGLLELQLMEATDKMVMNTLRDSQLRVQSIAMIHEKLYQSEALSDISFDKYLKDLVRSIASTYGSGEMAVDFSYDLDSFSLDVDQAIPCSLIVNEVIVNCYKHAFPSTQEGEIELRLEYEKPNVKLTIVDDGDGLPENFDIHKQQSLGLTLIQTLASQLEGEVAFSSDESGTMFELAFDRQLIES